MRAQYVLYKHVLQYANMHAKCIIQAQHINMHAQHANMLTPFPGLPHLCLQFAFSIIYRGGRVRTLFCIILTQTEERKRGRPGNKATNIPYAHTTCIMHVQHPARTAQK